MLANLELLEEELTGEQRDTAASALRSSRRMRRLVADLLLLARADAGREAPHQPVDLSEVVTDAAAELEPVAGDHEISISAPPGAHVDGARDELHRLVLNLMENALRHTDPGTAVEATVERHNGAGRARGRGRRAGHPPRSAREGLRALLPRHRRSQRVLRASVSRSCARSPSRTRAPSGSRSRWTAAGPDSWSASRPLDALKISALAGPIFREAMSDITSQQLVVFSLGSEEYALPIGSVHEIIRYTEPRTVASDAAWIRGVIGLRGKIIPIFDLASAWSSRPSAPSPARSSSSSPAPARSASWSTRSRRS